MPTSKGKGKGKGGWEGEGKGKGQGWGRGDGVREGDPPVFILQIGHCLVLSHIGNEFMLGSNAKQ